MSSLNKWSIEANDVWMLWQTLVEKLPSSKLELVVCIYRNIWSGRNNVIFNDVFDSPSLVIGKARQQLESYRSALLMESNRGVGPST